MICDATGTKYQVKFLVLGTVVKHKDKYGHLTGFAYNVDGELLIKAKIPTLDYDLFSPDELTIYVP